MGSEQNDSTSFSPSEPKLCANGCGFFGTAANMNFCSKCYRDIRIEEEQAASAKVAVENSFNLKPKQLGLQVGDLAASANIVATPTVELLLPSSIEGSSTGDAKLAVSGQGEPSRRPNRCQSCNKKVAIPGFKCKCGSIFCGEHRYPETHECTFDFKGTGRDAIAKSNPVVKADKVDRF